MQQQLLLAIAPNGVIETVYSDELAELYTEGRIHIRRASNVEPGPEGWGWYADLSPVDGPVLGPFPLRETALRAEVEWLAANRF